MNKNDQLDKRYRTVTWAALFLLIGSLSLIPGDQTSWAVLGGGIILLGLNLGRSISKLPVSGFSLSLGVIALFVGALVLARSAAGIDFEIDLLAITLIAIGVYWLIPERKAADPRSS